VYVEIQQVGIAEKTRYLYRAVDSTGQTIEFLLTAKRDAAAAKRFLVKAIEASGNAMPRVLNVDKNPAGLSFLSAAKRKCERSSMTLAFCRTSEANPKNINHLQIAPNENTNRQPLMKTQDLRVCDLDAKWTPKRGSKWPRPAA
jgi:transposase-like protein